MDTSAIQATKSLVRQYSDLAVQSFETRRKKVLTLFTRKSCPEEGWRDEEIEVLLHEIAMMDSNNFFGSCSIGERESRFASKIVARRHYYMGHGIGRSGDITEIQPKAAGSTLIGRLANTLLLDVLKGLGMAGLAKCIVVPLATGMGMLLCLRTLHHKRPQARFVLWLRLDQKSCFKCILTAGLTPVIIHNEILGDRQLGSVEEIEIQIQRLGAENIVCVLSTTSSFAPKEPDRLTDIAALCEAHDIPHIVNNAYGVQCPAYLKAIEKAAKKRVDLFVSSTDKNFMVPVGGSLIGGYSEELVDDVGRMYPGRGSCTPSVDVFITLLNIGKKGYAELLERRELMFEYLKEELSKVSMEFGERVLDVPGNRLSLALTLSQFETLDRSFLTEIGSMLFSKFVIGTRVVTPGDTKNIGGYEFKNWGMHVDELFVSYLTASATIGVRKQDIDVFIKNLRQVLSKIQKHVHQNIGYAFSL